ncbi:MAG: hypothetical protein AAFV93_14585 [Chloroflexota bacterium]
MTRGHWTIVAIWVGLPVVIGIVLNFLSPGYMRTLFETDHLFSGLPTLLCGMTLLNFAVLMVGFSIYTTRRNKDKLKVEDFEDDTHQKKMPFVMSCFLFLMLLLCTIPTLWLTVMGPAAMRIADEFFLTPIP